ncbi:toll/interleukin-1 receptor domain-containing protein [Methanobrevibacter arboriphilus]|uniref:toll/interleukin-1 receptor domain-containing protein n=2 Tax=Methanobrevibacter arboriphilus TaxID=39441 RepID=UPI001C80CB95|nr:toll/interleukin-1 receptor domain-containing protein [Methanobrevibacter arboriphilus]
MDDLKQLKEKVGEFEEMLIDIATNNTGDDENFDNLRKEIMNSKKLSGAIPNFIITKRNPYLFRTHMQDIGGYKDRREHIYNGFTKIYDRIDELEDNVYNNNQTTNLQANVPKNNQIINNEEVIDKLNNNINDSLTNSSDDFETTKKNNETQIEPKDNQKKVFISHSSKDKHFADELIEILEYIGVPSENIFCTSVEGYGIPLGENFLETIKNELTPNTLVLFLISENFYGSPVSLCEMGATWIQSNFHIPILIPPMTFEKIKGVIPLTEGLLINNKAKINSLKMKIENDLSIKNKNNDFTKWERKRNKFLENIEKIIENNNTPSSKTEDINVNKIEKHYHSMYESENLDIIEQFKHYLTETNDWDINFDKTKKAFNKKHPEFKIEISERGDMSSIEPYCTFFLNNESTMFNIKFEYNSTQLFAEEELLYIFCDGYRSHFPNPSMKVFDSDYPMNAFYYYNLEEVQGLFGELCKKTKPENFIMDRGYRELPFLVFNNSQELNDFTNFLKNNMKLLEGIEVNFQFNISDPMNYKRSIDLETFFKVKKIHDLYEMGYYD